MIEDREIRALFHLIDDPDEEVFSTVSDKLVSLGKGILPNLENLWESTPDSAMQRRIEMVIHRLYMRDLREDIIDWRDSSGDILQGALLVARYVYPELNISPTMQEIEKIRRNIWLELNSYLTPLEQIAVISGILFSYCKFKGNEVSYDISEDFLVPKLIENKRGNPLSIGILYLAMCQMLDIPVMAINIPKQFILAYFASDFDYKNPSGKEEEKLVFFIDPLNGQVYSQTDVDNYFKRIGVPSIPSYYKKLTNRKVIQHLISELSKCYTLPANEYKGRDLAELARLLDI